MEVYVVCAIGKTRNRMVSPPAIRAASAPQSALTRARQHHIAMKVLHLKCLAAVTAIIAGRKVKGVQEIKLSTA